MMETTYKEIKIWYNEASDKWEAQGGIFEATLSEAKKSIDKWLKQQVMGIKVLTKSWYGGYIEGVITSNPHTKSYNGIPEYWIYTSKGRSRESIINLFADTDENHQVITELANLSKKKSQLDDEYKKLCESLKQIVIGD